MSGAHRYRLCSRALSIVEQATPGAGDNQRAVVMRVNGFRRAIIAATALTAVLAGCASTPQPSSTHLNGTSMVMPMHATASTPPPQPFSFGSMLRHMSHALVSGVSWLFQAPPGVYGPPEKVAYSSAQTWKEGTNSTGCTLKCDRVQRNSVNPIP